MSDLCLKRFPIGTYCILPADHKGDCSDDLQKHWDERYTVTSFLRLARLASVGIGPNGLETHTYVVRVFGQFFCDKYRGEAFFDSASKLMAREVKVKVLSQMQVNPKPCAKKQVRAPSLDE